MRRLSQITAWLLLFAIAALSLVPPSYRPVTGIPNGLEHLGIFLAAGLGFGFGYPKALLSRMMLLVVFVAGVEIVQLWIPGRHARFSDYLIDTIGLVLGVGLGYLIARLYPIANH